MVEALLPLYFTILFGHEPTLVRLHNFLHFTPSVPNKMLEISTAYFMIFICKTFLGIRILLLEDYVLQPRCRFIVQLLCRVFCTIGFNIKILSEEVLFPEMQADSTIFICSGLLVIPADC
jgi:hypothetical protein